MDKQVPGMVPPRLSYLVHAASEGGGEWMLLFLFREHSGGDFRRAVGATVRDAKHLATLAALAEFLEQRLFKQRFKGPANGFLLVPRPNGDGNARRCRLFIICHACCFVIGARLCLPD